MYKIGQSGGILSRLLWPLLKTGLPLMKKIPLAKSVLVITATSATDAAIRENIFESDMTKLKKRMIS